MEDQVTPPQQKKPFIRRIWGFRSGKPWKMVIASIGYFFILLIIIGIANSGKSTPTNTPVTQPTTSISTPAPTPKVEQPTVQKPDLEMVETHNISEEYVRYVGGTVKNNTDHSYGYVQVEINLYDADGNQVGSTMANTNNLEADGTWKFKAPILDDSAQKYKVKEVTGF